MLRRDVTKTAKMGTHLERMPMFSMGLSVWHRGKIERQSPPSPRFDIRSDLYLT
jgi:hypothetical protein